MNLVCGMRELTPPHNRLPLDTDCLEADLCDDPEAFNELVKHWILRKS